MHSRFVKPETVTLPISRGDTITVKKRLTAGETRAAHRAMYEAGADGETVRRTPTEVGLQMVLAYLIDWTITDDGAPVPIRHATIDEKKSLLNALDPEDFAEIREAINRHEERIEQERAAEKKALGGETPSSATSASPSSPAGPLTTSEPSTTTITA